MDYTEEEAFKVYDLDKENVVYMYPEILFSLEGNFAICYNTEEPGWPCAKVKYAMHNSIYIRYLK